MTSDTAAAGRIVDRATWQAERAHLLQREKAVTHELDALAQARRALPWVPVEQTYAFEVPGGRGTLLDLFGGCRQLIVYHLMFGPGWDAPCPGCSAWADAFNGTLDQIRRADARLVAVSRAPLEQIEPVREQRGWAFLWASSYGSRFNHDFFASADFGPDESGQARPTGVADEVVEFDRGENHGVSVFVRDGDAVYHTYSAYNRGIQQLNGAFGYVDLLAFSGG